MEDIIEELNNLNKQLEDYFLEGENEYNHEGFNKLIMVDFDNPQLREALILMHSKYTAEMEALRKYHFKYLNRIVHINKNAYGKVLDIKKDLIKEIESTRKNRGITLPKAFITSISLIFVLGSLFYMFTIDREAGLMIVDIIKHGFDVLINGQNQLKVD